MEINRILFGQLNNGKIDKSFDDLDVNHDGRITSADMDLTDNNEIKSSISAILNNADDDAYIVLVDEQEETSSMSKAGASNSAKAQATKGTISVTDAANYEKDVLNSTGVTYVVMGNLGECSYCDEVDRAINQFKDQIADVANLYNMSWKDNTNLCREITYNLGGVKQPAGFPQIAKFVDGKFVSMMPLAVNDTYFGVDASGKEVNISSKNRGQVMSNFVSKLISEATVADPTLVRNRNGVAQTNSAKFNDDVTQSKGTTYVVMCSNTCGYCNELDRQLGANLSKIEDVANLFSLNWDTDTDLCRKISYEMGNIKYPAAFPVIAKFVDGKFVGIVPDTSGGNVYNNNIVQKLLDMAEGSPATKYQMENGAGDVKNTAKGFQPLTSQNLNKIAGYEKRVGGTAYVCLYSPTQAKTATDALISAGQSIDDANFYYVDSSKDAELCMNLAKQAGYTESTIPYPLLIRYEAGRPVEIINNTTITENVENEELTEFLADKTIPFGRTVNNLLSMINKIPNTSGITASAMQSVERDGEKRITHFEINNIMCGNDMEGKTVVTGYEFEITYDKDGTAHITKTEKLKNGNDNAQEAGETETWTFDNSGKLIMSGSRKNLAGGFQVLTPQNLSEIAALENKVGGTAYVCLYSPTQAKSATDALVDAGKSSDNANFYYVDSSKNAELCMNLAKQAGYTESTIPYPLLIRYEAGRPVEIIDNSTISAHVENDDLSEFLEEKMTAFGVNNDLSEANDVPSENVTEEQELQESQLKKLQSDLENLSVEMAFKNVKKQKIKNELDLKQKQIEDIEKQIKNAGENTETSALQSKLNSLKSAVNSLNLSLKILDTELNSLTNKYDAKSSAMEIQNSSISRLSKK